MSAFICHSHGDYLIPPVNGVFIFVVSFGLLEGFFVKLLFLFFVIDSYFIVFFNMFWGTEFPMLILNPCG